MIVNGDIYTWGNNANRITGIDYANTKFTGKSDSNRYPVITGMVRLKVKSDYTNFNNADYFSSPLRPKFVDFFATVYTSTCGITTKGELFCGGTTGIENGFGTMYTHVDVGGGQ